MSEIGSIATILLRLWFWTDLNMDWENGVGFYLRYEKGDKWFFYILSLNSFADELKWHKL